MTTTSIFIFLAGFVTGALCFFLRLFFLVKSGKFLFMKTEDFKKKLIKEFTEESE